MFGRRYFGGRYYGPRYFGDGGALAGVSARIVNQFRRWMGMKIYNKATAITPSDATDLPALTDGIYVGGAGVVVAVFQDGSTASFTAVAGEILPLRVKRVNSTSTTASLLVALYQV